MPGGGGRAGAPAQTAEAHSTQPQPQADGCRAQGCATVRQGPPGRHAAEEIHGNKKGWKRLGYLGFCVEQSINMRQHSSGSAVKHGTRGMPARARLSNADAACTEQVRHLDVARLVGPHEAVPHRKVRHD